MPSFCAVDSCKLVKQIGADISFHKFPFHKPEIFKQWVDFVVQADSNNEAKKLKKITKFSSICGQHFTPQDFSQSSLHRKFLRKSAVPSIISVKTTKTPQQEDDVQEVEVEDPLFDDFCSLCRATSTKLELIDDHHSSLIEKTIGKCTPINSIFIQKICKHCVDLLAAFSLYIDKVSTSQQIFAESILLEQEDASLKRRIKVEPIANFEDEVQKTPSIHVIDFTQQSYLEPPRAPSAFMPQKKCEILEIVDIKPFHFHDGALQQEQSYEDEDEIQILSPKQLKVELTDQDEDGSNELELIKNYMFISTVFLQDHNYVKPELMDKPGVKTEYDPEMESFDNSPYATTTFKICNICYKNFKTFKRLLIHKTVEHPTRKAMTGFKKNLIRMKHRQVQRTCSKIIKRKQRRIVTIVIRDDSKKRVKRKDKSYMCPICLKTFHGPKNLYQHKISHTTSHLVCPFDMCDRKFKRPHGLKQHIRSFHEKQKTHVCPICNYGYSLKADMTKCRHSKLRKCALV